MRADAVVVLDLRVRLRRGLTYFLLTTLVALFCCLALAIYLAITSQPALPVPTIGATSAPAVSPLGGASRVVWASRSALMIMLLGTVQALALLIVVPALASGTIAGERERQTYDLLATTLSPRRIALGKLISVVLSIALIVATSLPIFGLAALLGPVVPTELGEIAVVLLGASVLYGAAGVFCSAWATSTFPAATLSYTVTALLFVGSAAAVGARATMGGAQWLYLAALNPVAALLSVVVQHDDQIAQALPPGLVTAIADDLVVPGLAESRLAFWVIGVVCSLLVASLLILATGNLLAPARRIGLDRSRPADQRPEG